MNLTLKRRISVSAGPPPRPLRVSIAGAGALITLGLLFVIAVAGPLLWPRDPLAQNIAARLQLPSFQYPLGTDQFGRDVLARLLAGARWSLSGAAIVCTGTSLLGFLIGALAASGSRRLDAILGRVIEALMALPSLVTALAFTAVLGPSFPNLLIALIVTSWPWYARSYRALLLKEQAALYVESARAMGFSRGRVIVRHVVPNVVGPALVLATANFGAVILNLAALSFLGLGMQPPTPEWGTMISDARLFFQRHPWQMIAPGMCIAVTVLAVNLAGDALRDLLDPRTQGKGMAKT